MRVKDVMKALKIFYPKPNWEKPRLVTIGLSHYSEKSRWALDMSPLQSEYYEEMHCPALHLTTTLVELSRTPRVRTWRKDSHFQYCLDSRYSEKLSRSKSITGVPKLVLPVSFLLNYNIAYPPGCKAAVVDGGSAGILRVLADVFPDNMGHLYPVGSIEETVVDVERQLDILLGPAATSWSFGNMILSGRAFQDSEVQPGSTSSNRASSDANLIALDYTLANLAKSEVPNVEKLLFRFFGKKAVPLMIKHNSVSAKSRAESKYQISAVFSAMDAHLERNNSSCSVERDFLLGTDELSAADITFASLALPVLMPQKAAPFFTTRQQLSQVPLESAPGLAQMVDFSGKLLEKHKSARYALDLYERRRPVVDIKQL